MASRYGLLLALFSAALVGICTADYCEKSQFKSLPYCNFSLPISNRVEDLLSRMTLAEKITQLGNTAGSIDRLDIPAYQWWSEGLHGVADSPGVHFNGIFKNATSFPQVITTASSFNKTLFYEIASAMSTEARAFANQGEAGLTYFTPNINIIRDPRWGRGQETPGEDPYLNSQYAINFVTGAQGPSDSHYLKVVTTCKHFAGYDLEDYIDGESRHNFNAITSQQDLEETYLPAFKACVEGGKVASIMCSYNAVNGVPSCANDLFNNKMARREWGFDGFIASDCGAIDDILNKHHYTNTTSQTVAAGLKGGCDLNCGGFYQNNAMNAFLNGTITLSDINLALTRLYTARMKLGMFDPPELQPYMSISPEAVNSKEHQELALSAARESIVLLQNKNDILPLDLNKHLNIAVVGPNAMATGTMQGNYNGVAPYLISPVEGFQGMGRTVRTVEGCDVKCEVTDGFQDAFDAVVSSDAVIAIMGLDQGQESEGHDREDLFLPNLQDKFLLGIKDSLAAVGSSAPFIVVVMSGSSVDLTVAKKLADGILWVGYPGQSGGQAIAEVIYGKVNPSGRLPMTFYPGSYINVIAFRHMSMREDPGRTYKFYNDTPVFSFGDGLSYTSFDFKWSNPVNYTVRRSTSDPQVTYNVTVTNIGDIPGATSVLAYVTYYKTGAPKKELFGFEKVFLNPREKTEITFIADSKAFSSVDTTGQRSVKAGVYHIRIGDQLFHEINLFD